MQQQLNKDKKPEVSGQDTIDNLKKVSTIGLRGLRKEFEKDKDVLFIALSNMSDPVEIHRIQGQIKYIRKFIAKIDTILNNS